MGFPSFKEITEKAVAAFKRFPITLSWAICGSLFFIGVINVEPDALFDHYTNSLLTFILGISWLIGAKFVIERTKNPEKWLWLKALVVLLLILFYLHLPADGFNDADPKFFIRFFLYLLAGHLLVFFAPFLKGWHKVAFWNYLKAVCIAIGRSVLFSGVLYLGLVLALLAVRFLFDFDIADKRYGQLFILCLGIVNTWTYLSDFPEQIQQATNLNYNKALEVFVKYILIPLVLLYLTILYAYGIKIVFEWDLPKGWVSYLVTALAFLGFIIQVMIDPVQKSIKSWVINRFHPWFYFLLLPLIVLLFVAIFKRIGEYGFTENRYFVLLIAIWTLSTSLYMLISKKQWLKVLPISLFVLTIMASFGFWGAFNVAKESQVNQFGKVYQRVLENKKIASGRQYEQLKSIVDFLGDRKSIDRLDPLVGHSVHEICRDTSENPYRTYDYYGSQRLLDSLGISIDPKEGITTYPKGNYYSYYGRGDINRSYAISGYDEARFINFYNANTNAMEIDRYQVEYDDKSLELRLKTKLDERVVSVIPIKDRLLALVKYGTDLTRATSAELTAISENDSIHLKLILTDLSFYVEKDSVSLSHATALLLLKRP